MRYILLVFILINSVSGYTQLIEIKPVLFDTTFTLEQNNEEERELDSTQVRNEVFLFIQGQYRRSSRLYSTADQLRRDANYNKNSIESFLPTSDYFDYQKDRLLEGFIGEWSFRDTSGLKNMEVIRTQAGNSRIREVDTPSNGGSIRFYARNMIEVRNYIPDGQGGTENVVFRQDQKRKEFYFGYRIDGIRVRLIRK